jgi:hypothetical protein
VHAAVEYVGALSAAKVGIVGICQQLSMACVCHIAAPETA